MRPRFRWNINCYCFTHEKSPFQTRTASTSCLEPWNPDPQKAPLRWIQLNHLQQFSRGIKKAGEQILWKLMGSGVLLASSFLSKTSRLAWEPGLLSDVEITNKAKTVSSPICEQTNIKGFSVTFKWQRISVPAEVKYTHSLEFKMLLWGLGRDF